MKNQDPLNPMDNAQVTSQLAQISTVSGIDKLNATLTQLLGANSANETLSAANMVGHSVLVPGTTMTLDQGQAVFGVELPQAADKVTVSITDASGKVLHTIDLGGQQAGVLALAWDGITDAGSAAAPGSYGFSVTATQGSNAVGANPLGRAVVEGIAQGANGPLLNLGAQGRVGLADIKQIL